MEYNFFENKYYNSYYYANIIDNILANEVELIGFISSFKENYGESLLSPFQKKSAFHCFIAHIISEFFLDDMYKHDFRGLEEMNAVVPKKKLYAEHFLENFSLPYSFEEFIGHKEFITLQNIEAYHEELHVTGYLEGLFDKLAEEVFYLLFNNRDLLIRFNIIMKHYVENINIKDLESEEIKLLINKKGKLYRKRIPVWVKNAVYFRDKGRCCKCGKDISGLLTLNGKKHFDHMVPLGLGGINDVSNIQLLCETCNLKKGAMEIYTSNLYEKWF